MPDPVDQAAAHLKAALDALGLDAELDPELARTPERFAALLAEYAPAHRAPPLPLSIFDAPRPDSELVAIAAIRVESLCVHHLLPFFGTIDVAYLPGTKLIGFGSVTRLIAELSRRPQIQERLVEQIAHRLDQALSPRGCLVRCTARQMCMEMRGAERRARIVTTASRGALGEPGARSAALRALDQARLA